MRRLAASALLLAANPAFAARPVVSKVEPPSWWAGHTLNPVRVLMTGRTSRARGSSPPVPD